MDNKYNVPTRDVGVAAARFQIDSLHAAHIELINIMLQTHRRVFIVLGLGHLKITPKNPLSFQMRKQAILEHYPKQVNLQILYLENCETDEEWSSNLDKLIESNIRNGETVRLCGGRDSFIPHYTTKKFETWLIKDFSQNEYISATAVRNEISKTTRFDQQFRRAVIHTASSILPQCVPAVDVVIYDNDRQEVLMGQHVKETGLCFIGVWMQAGETVENACNRAAKQKAGITIKNMVYKTSFSAFDWRFYGEGHDLTTMVFYAQKASGIPEALDNMVRLKWVKYDDVINEVCSRHRVIAEYLVQNLKPF